CNAAAGDASRDCSVFTTRHLPARFAVSAAVVSTTTAAAITITTVTAATTTTTAKTTTAAAAAIFARLRFVDFQRATADFLAIELLDGCIGFFGRGHFHERKTA